MQKIIYFTYLYHLVLFFCSKSCQTKFNSLFDYENQQQNELQNIAFNHSADIDYDDFMKIYREYTKEPYSFLKIDTTLPANDPLRFIKTLLPLYKNDSN